MNKKKIAIINGPNMNILGKRELSIYGTENLESIESKVKTLSQQFSIELLFYQSNYEGDIVGFIQQNMDDIDGIVINPSALSKVGYSILDALNAKPIPYVEVHMTNTASRGDWHSESIFSKTAVGLIMGFKSYVYELGLQSINYYLEEN